MKRERASTARMAAAPADLQRRANLRAAFASRFGREPSLWVRAPGRVEVMGSHTDYNDCFVLTLSIDRDTWIAAAPRSDGRMRVESLNLSGGVEFAVDDVMARRADGWSIYVQAVAAVAAQQGLVLPGCDALAHGTLPIASGLSSSASLEVATAVLLATFGAWQQDGVSMARLCQRAENEIVGVTCGILDQYSSMLGEAGSALLLDCRELTHRSVAIPRGLQAVICNTLAPRELSGSQYGERRASCMAGTRALAERIPGVTALRDVDLEDFARHERSLDASVARRCRFILEENARVHELARALDADDRTAIGSICERSFAGARDLFEITVAEMQAMQEAMIAAPGVVAARQTGAGFGGCMIALVETDAVDAFVAAVSSGYERRSGIHPEIYPVCAAPGAGLLQFH